MKTKNVTVYIKREPIKIVHWEEKKDNDGYMKLIREILDPESQNHEHQKLNEETMELYLFRSQIEPRGDVRRYHMI